MKEKDKVVGHIYETWDYDKFKFVAQNRGQMATEGVNLRKVGKLQEIIDQGKYVDERAIVSVNENFLVIDGRHTFEVLRANKKPIRYMVVRDHRFNNGTSRRQLVNNIYSINTVNTAWTGEQFFQAAVQTKAPLAILMQQYLDKHADGNFKWTDVLGVLTNDEDFFAGHFSKIDLVIFEDRKLIERFNTAEFEQEMEFFKKLNYKSLVAARKGTVLKAAYQVINKAAELIDVAKFKKSLLKMNTGSLQSVRVKTLADAIKQMVRQYNSDTGSSLNAQAVLQQIRSKFERIGGVRKAEVAGNFKGKFATVEAS